MHLAVSERDSHGRSTCVTLDEPFDHALERIARGIEHVVLAQAVDLREQQLRLDRRIGPPDVVEVSLERAHDRVGELSHRRPERLEHVLLHPQAVPHRPELAMARDDGERRAQ